MYLLDSRIVALAIMMILIVYMMTSGRKDVVYYKVKSIISAKHSRCFGTRFVVHNTDTEIYLPLLLNPDT